MSPAHTVRGKHKKIVRLYRQGLSLTAIAKLADVFTTQVTQVLERAGEREPSKQPKRDPKKEQRIARDYAAGMPLADLVEKYDVSEWKVRDCAERAGVPWRSRGQQPKRFTHNELRGIVAAGKRGISHADISRMFNTSPGKVGSILRQHGVVGHRGPPRGKRHGSWKGGVVYNPDGYRLVRVPADDPFVSMSNVTGYVPEHRLVMARHLNRPLTKRETVHHIDGNPANNAIENLQLRQGKHGNGIRHVCLDCGSSNVGPAPLGH
jgi:hypothetical protein